MKRRLLVLAVPSVLLALVASRLGLDGAEPGAGPANEWVRLEKAEVGARPDPMLVYDATARRFLVLGGDVEADKKTGVRPYDDLALDVESGQWENLFPPGKEWGPRFGGCAAALPGWAYGEAYRDKEGNFRPKVRLVYQQYAYASEAKQVAVFVQGKTLAYSPAERLWKDLAPKASPAERLEGTALCWGSMCYLAQLKKVLLFGGCCGYTGRRDPGTWLYDPDANSWEEVKAKDQPPPRANSQLVYDPVNRRAVLFGGDRLDALFSDTWTFDGEKWQERKPDPSPPPRAGHALLWLPEATNNLLLGGYGYASDARPYYPAVYRSLPMDAWVYDTAANTWQFVREFSAGGSPPNAPAGNGARPLKAAAGEQDMVLALSGGTWLCRIDVSGPDAEGTARRGVRPGTMERREKHFDPAWYAGEAAKWTPPGDPEAVAAGKPNAWHLRPAACVPRQSGTAWSSAVFLPDRDQILRHAGGHCHFIGSAPQIYDIKTSCWSIPYAPEACLEFEGMGGIVPVPMGFGGRPWTTATRKFLEYDPSSKKVVYARRYAYDPATATWTVGTVAPFGNYAYDGNYDSFYVPTPTGCVAWAVIAPHPIAAEAHGGPGELFIYDAASASWKKLPLQGTLPKGTYSDAHSMVYDSKRDRLLLFIGRGPSRGDATAYDMKTGKVESLGPAGRDGIADGMRMRESVYLPESDAVLHGTRIKDPDGTWRWLLYDCGRNAWRTVPFAGDGPLTDGETGQGYDNGMAMMYDARRRLVWALGGGDRNSVHFLRPDLLSADIRDLNST